MTSAMPSRRFWSPSRIGFVILMTFLTALFVTLGTWQVQRLAEKDALIATVEDRFDQPPAPFPALGEWAALDPEAIDYRPVVISGVFDNEQTVLVFTNLVDRAGQYGGVGYWVLAPLMTPDGGVAWINRGFVPETQAADFINGGADAPTGSTTIEAIARRPQQVNAFTPAPDVDARREWVLDPTRLAAFLPDSETAVAPVILDAVAGPVGALPQGGETQVTFPNRHLEYAGTWYLFAAITPIMVGFWLWRQRRPANLAQPDRAN